MKILFYEWPSFLQNDIKLTFKEFGISYSVFSWTFADKNVDEAFESHFEKEIDATGYDAIFSINYFPLLSKVAGAKGLKYIAWCYDNPLNVTDLEATLGNEWNTVVFFDRIQAENYQKKGFSTTYYLPLAVNHKRLSKVTLSSTDGQKYKSDVSFIGSLYESRINDIKNILSEHDQGFVDALLVAQQPLYGCYLFDEVITTDWVNRINEQIHKDHLDTNFVLLKEALTFAMASEVTRKERLMLLTLLGRRFSTKLYTYHQNISLDGVTLCPPVDYFTEMPKIFRASKINLNPSLRCIQSGIPLRALDILGVGGFLLSNYQMELAEYFTEEEVCLYESLEDAIEKASFYVREDSLRTEMANRAMKKVHENFRMDHRLSEIFALANLT